MRQASENPTQTPIGDDILTAGDIVEALRDIDPATPVLFATASYTWSLLEVDAEGGWDGRECLHPDDQDEDTLPCVLLWSDQ